MSTTFKCAKRNDVEQLKILISEGVDINQTTIRSKLFLFRFYLVFF